MRFHKIVLFSSIVLILTSGCNRFLNRSIVGKSVLKTIRIYSDYNLLPVNQTWLEAREYFGEWVRILPCVIERKFTSFEIVNRLEKTLLIWHNGTEIQEFYIEDLKYKNKTFIFKTCLPFDTSEKLVFQLKKTKKNIFEWTVYKQTYFFIAKKDLDQFVQISETCAE